MADLVLSRGVVALVDDEDLDRVIALRKWWTDNRGYVITSVIHPAGGLRADGIRLRRMTLLLHRFVMGLEYGDPRQVDHIDRVKTNCSKQNLRVGTNFLNSQNRPSYRGGTSSFRGVSFHSGAGKWEACAKLDGKKHYLGIYTTEAEAAEVVRIWRIEHMPWTVEDV